MPHLYKRGKQWEEDGFTYKSRIIMAPKGWRVKEAIVHAGVVSIIYYKPSLRRKK